MRILFVTDLFPIKEDEKKTPKTLSGFVNFFREQGQKVDVIKPNFLLNSFLRGKPFYKTGKYGDINNVNYLTPFWFDVKERLPKLDYDVVVAHMPSGIIFSNKLGMPTVCGVHASDLEVLQNPLYSIYFKKEMEKAYKNAVAIACRSPQILKTFLKLYPQYKEKTFIAASGSEFEPILRKAPFSTPIKVLSCAQLIKRKNIDKVVRALKGKKDFSLSVIGEGKQLKRLKNIDKSVDISGFQPHEEVFERMKESDIFILPSIGETLGMVYLEALSAGGIVVGTKNDGVDGIIVDGENGFLTEPNESEILAVLEKIKNLDEKTLEKLRKNTFETAKQYTHSKCCEDYLQKILKAL